MHPSNSPAIHPLRQRRSYGAPDQNQQHCYYELTMDDPQTFRQVFDYDRLGLWMNSRTPLSSEEDVPTEFLPGILFNDGVKPFQLFRMGYTWHAKVVRTPPVPDPLFAVGPEIERPILMELIDVTVPRRNTVEAVELWEQFITGEMRVEPQSIGILEAGNRRSYVLPPLPTLPYHLHENATMICEVADGSSKHKDKLTRRLDRIDQIWGSGMIPAATMQAMFQPDRPARPISWRSRSTPVSTRPFSCMPQPSPRVPCPITTSEFNGLVS